MTMKRTFLMSAVLIPLCLYAEGIRLKCAPIEAKVYHQNQAVIDSLFSQRYPEEVMRINYFYHVPKEGREKVESFIKLREFKLICQDFLNKDSLEKRFRNKLIIERIYRDSINTILIPAYSNHLSGENVSYALHCRKQLRLDDIQYSTLMRAALDMANRIRKDRRVNVWNEEMELLKKTLDKKQLHNFFVNKNSAKVTEEFDKAWDRLKLAGLTEQLDSAKDANDAVNYLFARQMIKDLYRNYGTSQKKYLAELDKNMPKIISMLNGLDKKARIERKRETVGKEFIW